MSDVITRMRTALVWGDHDNPDKQMKRVASVLIEDMREFKHIQDEYSAYPIPKMFRKSMLDAYAKSRGIE